MATELPRPGIGACIRVLPEVDRYPGREGIVIAFDVPAPLLNRERDRIIGTCTWDLGVVFPGGVGCAYDLDEVEITHANPWEALT